MDPKLATALEGLRDIHLPPPVAFWPLAYGWWALTASVVLAAVALVLWQRWRRTSVKRAALGELSALEALFGAQPDPVELAVLLTTLLRRVALARLARADVAALHGETWIAFLTRGSPDGASAPLVLRDLIQTAYRGARSQDAEPREWLAFARRWIREVA